jgi:hypothetical protein
VSRELASWRGGDRITVADNAREELSSTQAALQEISRCGSVDEQHID